MFLIAFCVVYLLASKLFSSAVSVN